MRSPLALFLSTLLHHVMNLKCIHINHKFMGIGKLWEPTMQTNLNHMQGPHCQTLLLPHSCIAVVQLTGLMEPAG